MSHETEYDLTWQRVERGSPMAAFGWGFALGAIIVWGWLR